MDNDLLNRPEVIESAIHLADAGCHNPVTASIIFRAAALMLATFAGGREAPEASLDAVLDDFAGSARDFLRAGGADRKVLQ